MTAEYVLELGNVFHSGQVCASCLLTKIYDVCLVVR